MPEDAPVNIGAMLSSPFRAQRRVLEIQTKLHHRAVADPGCRFGDLFNLVVDPAFLAVAWERVRENKGARSAGVDGRTVHGIERSAHGAAGLLEELRADVKARTFRPLPVKERLIPKANGKLRRLGIPTVRDRVVQAALKLVLEPILEADFQPCSYGFRPERRAQDAIEEIRNYATNPRSYTWVFEGDIAACFDEIDHTALMELVRRRIVDRRVLSLVKAFLKAGLLDELDAIRDTSTGTPQGGILSPLLANVALSVLDEHFTGLWQAHGSNASRTRFRQRGGATYRLVRYADDFVVMVKGTREQALRLFDEVGGVLSRVGLRLAPDKTHVVHIDEGFDFLGFRIQRHQQWGSDRHLIYSYPSRKSRATVKRKVKEATRHIPNQTADELFRQLNRITRGWALYFRHGASKAAFQDLDHFLWWRSLAWLVKKHPKRSKKWILRRYYPGGKWWPEANGVEIRPPGWTAITRYRYRGNKILTPWALRPETGIS
ncbi:group II intron reverse transcriptase/maturase [Streptomyces lancefieldiae]|uniref:Group II intron reverse transcriptase/maturase n=1 Tax=Streptomyces lancefieldiae TaxID=3075520 RepID=A0ABU3AZD1_9ACTN|nr:group II intron reverse transcriptase/maturase [Streptomyces sp. DSM 40712]MDT0615550.1 group II intron reverse transcriptase/maturase [Streptomyces sp. DSM 40712]